MGSPDNVQGRTVEVSPTQFDSLPVWILAAEPEVVINADGGDAANRPLDPVTAFRVGRNIVVPDGKFAGWHKILVFDSVGTFMHAAGRVGKGPCEFGQLWWAAAYRGDSILAYDFADRQLSVLTKEGQCAREFKPPLHFPADAQGGQYGYSPDMIGVLGDGSVLHGHLGYLDVRNDGSGSWYRRAVIHLSPEGEPIDSLGVFAIELRDWNGEEARYIPYGPTALYATSATSWYFGTNDRYEINRADERGNINLTIRMNRERRPFTRRAREEYMEWYVDQVRHSPERSDVSAARARRESGPWPLVFPEYSALLVDEEDNLWVEDYRTFNSRWVSPETDTAVWRVFASNGTPKGRVVVPGRLAVTWASTSEVLGHWTNEDETVEIRLYRVNRN